MSHILTSFWYDELILINRAERTSLKTCPALQALRRIDDKRLFKFSGNRVSRTVTRALGTSAAFFRINLIREQILADVCAAALFLNMFSEFLRESVQSADDRVSARLFPVRRERYFQSYPQAL